MSDTFLYDLNTGIYCNKQCAKEDGVSPANLRKLEEITVNDLDADHAELSQGEDSEYWYWTEENDGSWTCSPQLGHTCDHCTEVLWE